MNLWPAPVLEHNGMVHDGEWAVDWNGQVGVLCAQVDGDGERLGLTGQGGLQPEKEIGGQVAVPRLAPG